MTNRSPTPVPGIGPGATQNRKLAGDVLVAGTAHGPAMMLGGPLSFWGGYDPAAGRIIDKSHPQFGASLAGTIMVMSHAKGSSSSSSVLAEAIRNRTGPAGIILRERDLIISIGAIVAAELYGLAVPVVCLDPASFDAVAAMSGVLRIHASGDTGGASIYLQRN